MRRIDRVEIFGSQALLARFGGGGLFHAQREAEKQEKEQAQQPFPIASGIPSILRIRERERSYNPHVRAQSAECILGDCAGFVLNPPDNKGNILFHLTLDFARSLKPLNAGDIFNALVDDLFARNGIVLNDDERQQCLDAFIRANPAIIQPKLTNNVYEFTNVGYQQPEILSNLWMTLPSACYRSQLGNINKVVQVASTQEQRATQASSDLTAQTLVQPVRVDALSATGMKPSHLETITLPTSEQILEFFSPLLFIVVIGVPVFAYYALMRRRVFGPPRESSRHTSPTHNAIHPPRALQVNGQGGVDAQNSDGYMMIDEWGGEARSLIALPWTGPARETTQTVIVPRYLLASNGTPQTAHQSEIMWSHLPPECVIPDEYTGRPVAISRAPDGTFTYDVALTQAEQAKVSALIDVLHQSLPQEDFRALARGGHISPQDFVTAPAHRLHTGERIQFKGYTVQQRDDLQAEILAQQLGLEDDDSDREPDVDAEHEPDDGVYYPDVSRGYGDPNDPNGRGSYEPEQPGGVAYFDEDGTAVVLGTPTYEDL